MEIKTELNNEPFLNKAISGESSAGFTYPYSLNFGLGVFLLASLILFLVVRTLLIFDLDRGIWGMIGLVITGYLGFVIWLFAKRILPAIRRYNALYIDQSGITDYIGNINVAWRDVNEVKLVPGRTALALTFALKVNNNDYPEGEVKISLRWISGKEDEIFESALSYFGRYQENDFAD